MLTQLILVVIVGLIVATIDQATFSDLEINPLSRKIIHGVFAGVAMVAVLYEYKNRKDGLSSYTIRLLTAFQCLMIALTVGTFVLQFNTTSGVKNDFLRGHYGFFFWILLVVVPLGFNYAQAANRHDNVGGCEPVAKDDIGNKTEQTFTADEKTPYSRNNFGHRWITFLLLLFSFLYTILFDIALFSYVGAMKLLFPIFVVCIALLHLLLVYTETCWRFQPKQTPPEGKLPMVRACIDLSLKITNKELIFMGFVTQVMVTFWFVMIGDGDDPSGKYNGNILEPLRAVALVWLVPLMMRQNEEKYDAAQAIKMQVHLLLKGNFNVARPVFFVQDDV